MNPIRHDYNGITINQQSQDGYINLNQMAEASGKRIDNWLRLNSTKELITEFHSRQSTSTTPISTSTSSDPRKLNSDLVHFEREPSSDLRERSSDLRNVPSDLRNVQPAFVTSDVKVEYGGGTWAHPHIAIQFAQWCSASFALQVSEWVCDWIATNKPPKMSKEHLQLEAVKINAANKLAIA